jgi:hypothetical protein
MATPEEIRKKLQDQAEQRINPLLKGLTMLTGGLAGEFTGTNEQIRQRNLAKRALMEEDLAALQEQRMNERMKLQRAQMLEDQLRLEAARNKDIAERQRLAEAATREAKIPEMRGFLESRANYQVGGDRGLGGAMAAPISALEPVEEVERQYSYEKALQSQEEEARKSKKDLTMQLTTKSGSTVYGTYDDLANRFPDEVKNISVAKEKPANISGRVIRDEFGKFVPVVDFGPGVTPQQVYDYTMEMNKQFGINPEVPTPEPGAGTPKIIGKGPAAAQGAAQVSRFGSTRPASAAAGAKKVVATEATAPTAPTPIQEEGYSFWTGRYPGQPEPVLGRVGMPTAEGIRGFLGPLGESISGAAERYAEPIRKLDLTNPEMVYNKESYKQYLRKQMGGY